MKKTFTLFIFLISLKIAAQSYLPVPTTGYTLDAVAENTTALLTTSGVLDGGGHVFYTQAYAAIVSSLYGLPNNGTLSSGTRTFQLQNYTAANVLYLPANGQQDSLTLITPAGFSSLSLLGFATEADGTMSVTVRFTDNSSQVFTGVTVNDWFNSATAFAFGFDRLTRATGVLENVGGAGNPRFFTHDLALLCANQNKAVKRIIIRNTSASAKICMWAVSGVAIPLTANASPVNLCNSGTATLTAGGTTTFTWLPAGTFTGATTNSVVVTPSVTTVYTVQGVTALNCTLTSMVTVNIYTTVPTLTVTNTANAGGICPTKTIALTAGGATSYTWTGGSVPITNGIPFAPTTAGDYTVTGGNACGTITAVTSVSVHPLPVIIAVASTPSLCSGLTLTLNTTGSNASTYTWTGGYTSGTGFSPVLTNTYVVTGTSALSCTASAAVVVTVITTPTLAPTSSTLINCIGNSVTLTATGATNYTWTSATQTVFTPTLAATPSATGTSTYTVTKSNANCFDTKVISVTTNSLPTIFAIVSPTIICALRPATLAVGGGVSYTWTAPNIPPFTGASPVVYPLVSTNYSVAASDGTCISRTTVSLSANPVPTIALTSATAICDGQPVTVNAAGGVNYTWTSTSGATFNNTLTITETPTTTSAYNITGDNIYGCTSTAMQVVIVNPNPTVTISSSRTLVCSGSPSTLTANGATNYTWTSNTALTNTTVVNPVSLTSAPVVYTAVGAYTTGCTGSKTFAVNVFVPALTVSGITNTCAGGVVTLVGGGGNNGTYSWNTGSSTSNFQTLTATVTAAAVFTLGASSTSVTTVCPATKTIAVGNYSTPVITAVAQRTTICIKETTQLYGDGGVSYTWNTGLPGGTITVNPQVQTNYTVTGTDANGCVGTGTVQVKISGCVGIEELNSSAASLLIYPNPNNGEFTVQSVSDLKLILVNELGQVIKTYELSAENSYKASVTGLAKGIYFLSGQTGTLNINQKVIVTK